MDHKFMLEAVQKIRSRNRLDLSNKKTFLLNLAFVHQIALASENLLAEAAEKTEGYLSEYYAEHCKEEIGHENWLADDLMTYGVYVSKLPRFAKAIEMAGSQYYLLKHYSPYCLLGYMLTVEGFPMPIDNIEKLENIYGADIMRTVRYHSINDIEHRKDLFAIIDKDPRPEILESALQTAMYINDFNDQINAGLHDCLIKEIS